jgi:diguanylate cyclase (GGDEF)-like protein
MNRIRTRLLLGTIFFGVVITVVSMLVVSWAVSHQYRDQARAQSAKAAAIIDDNLNDRKSNQLIASRQLATQKNLGSTLWYLSQYAQTVASHETLFATYQQLVKDTYKIGRVAQLSDIAIYDFEGELVSFAQFDGHGTRVGYVERTPDIVFQVAVLADSEELNRSNLRTMSHVPGLSVQLNNALLKHEQIDYVIHADGLAIRSQMPIMGEVFGQGQQAKQLGWVVMVQPLGQAFVEQVSRLTDTRVNVFVGQHLSSANLPAYQALFGGGSVSQGGTGFNEIEIGRDAYYQRLLPLLGDGRHIATIAVLTSQETVLKYIRQMLEILGLIALGSLLLILPFAWYLANSITRPLTLLSQVLRGVASGQETINRELVALAGRRGDELGELAESFFAMSEAVKQKIRQINEINASLEDSVSQRTRELQIANDELTKLATHDVLTGLPNRQLVNDRLLQALSAARRDKLNMALMFIDLDEFKPVNDKYGHAVGDLLLKEAAKRIHDCLRKSDTVARIGGDEFIVLLPVIETKIDACGVAEKIRASLNEPFILAGEVLNISSSIGIALYPEHGLDEHALCQHADRAMYEVKNGGRNAVRVFQEAA